MPVGARILAFRQVVSGGASQSFYTTQTPANQNQADGVPYELGVRFMFARPGQITALRYWKAASETGAQTGRVWSSTGVLLASVVYSGGASSGWRQQSLASPLLVSAGVVYTISVNINSHYPSTLGGFNSARSNGDISTSIGAGVYSESPGSYPQNVYQNEEYFVDVVFVPS